MEESSKKIYLKCKYRVKKWEGQFKDENGRNPSKVSLFYFHFFIDRNSFYISVELIIHGSACLKKRRKIFICIRGLELHLS